jgi:hypothetical protein
VRRRTRTTAPSSPLLSASSPSNPSTRPKRSSGLVTSHPPWRSAAWSPTADKRCWRKLLKDVCKMSWVIHDQQTQIF